MSTKPIQLNQYFKVYRRGVEVYNHITGVRTFHRDGKVICRLPPFPTGLQIADYVYKKWKVTHAS